MANNSEGSVKPALGQLGKHLECSLQRMQNVFSWDPCAEYFKVIHYFKNTEACLGRRIVSGWPVFHKHDFNLLHMAILQQYLALALQILCFFSA